jgi:hypothetical protein
VRVLKCHLCGRPLSEGTWVLLNRYAIGGNDAFRFIQGQDTLSGYAWDPDLRRGTGATLCLQPCLVMWLSGKMIEADFMFRSEDA